MHVKLNSDVTSNGNKLYMVEVSLNMRRGNESFQKVKMINEAEYKQLL